VDRLFASWRYAYVTGSRDSTDCVFCAAQQAEEASSLIVEVEIERASTWGFS